MSRWEAKQEEEHRRTQKTDAEQEITQSHV